MLKFTYHPDILNLVPVAQVRVPPVPVYVLPGRRPLLLQLGWLVWSLEIQL